MHVALIRRNGVHLSLHRLVQKSFAQSPYGLESCQAEAFDGAAALLNHNFPRYGEHSSLTSEWQKCGAYLPHALALAQYYTEHSKGRRPLASTADFNELLKNCIWYMFEIGELKDSLKLLGVAFEACREKRSELYAYLCNSAGTIYYELNDLIECRRYNEECLNIRTECLKAGHADFANTWNNTANLLLSEGRVDEAIKMITLAEESRELGGEIAKEYLGMSHLNKGRMYFVKKEYNTAREYYKRSRSLLLKSGYGNDWFLGA